MTSLNVAGRAVGAGHPCFVIAEVGVNHNGDIGRAIALIDVAADAGADAVKFQTFSADRLVTSDAPKARYQERNTGSRESQLEMLKHLELTPKGHTQIVQHCRDRNILFMSTPFDERSADFLLELGVAAFKIPSGEMTNVSYLRHIARMRRPMVVSTGMCTLAEVETAVEAVEGEGHHDFALLHCLSNYPADPAEVNLRAMDTLRAAFDVPVGYSDHTLGIEIALAAVARGCAVLEKHYTLDRTLPGPDHAASLEPAELADMMRMIRRVESSLGDGRKRPAASELDTARVARKSLVAARDLPAGTVLTAEDVTIMRPGTGLPPMMQQHVVGRTTSRAVASGTLLSLEMFS